jgi:hypothetical protein
MSDTLTLGAVADRFGVQTWKVRRLYERKILPQPRGSGPTGWSRPRICRRSPAR